MPRIRWILVLSSLLLSSCYSLQQAYWFNNAFNSRVRVSDVLLSADLTDADRRKLLLSRQVLAFAQKQGLNVDEAYQHFIPPGPGTVSYLVQAAEADRLELKTWWFPIAGRVPYLGYFNGQARDDKASELRADGFDVSLGTVGAFSSLGWFEDPLYAGMLRYSDEDFIQILLHELVHRSFWSKGSAAFNENLAEFASLQMTEMFLKLERGGAGLADLKNYLADKEQLTQWISSLRSALEELYARPLNRSEKIAQKYKIIEDFRLHRFPSLKTQKMAGAKDREWNNASLLGAALYAPDTKRFQSAYDCMQPKDMGSFLEALRQVEAGVSQVEQALDSLCRPGADKKGD